MSGEHLTLLLLACWTCFQWGSNRAERRELDRLQEDLEQLADKVDKASDRAAALEVFASAYEALESETPGACPGPLKVVYLRACLALERDPVPLTKKGGAL